MSAPAGVEVYEAASLADLEAVVQDGLDTFVDVGLALLAIKDRGLYREQHASWESYLQARWDLDRTYAHRIMAAARVTSALPMGNKPTSERQARPLTQLPPEQAEEAWTEATEEAERPTAEVVRRHVESVKTKYAGRTGAGKGATDGERGSGLSVAPSPPPEPAVADVVDVVPWSFKKEVTEHEPRSAREAASFLDAKVIKNPSLFFDHLDHLPARLRRAASTEAREQVDIWTKAAERLSSPTRPRSA